MSWLRASLRRSRPPILRNVEPETVIEAFRMHWLRALEVIEKSSGGTVMPTADDITGVLNHLDQMVNFLIDEATSAEASIPNGGMSPSSVGPILDYMLMEGVLDRLFQWSLYTGEFLSNLKLEQLRIYEVLVSHSHHELLLQQPFLRPLLHLLASCTDCAPLEVEKRLVVLLNTLCVSLSQHPDLLEVFFSASSNQGPASSTLRFHFCTTGECFDNLPAPMLTGTPTGGFLIFSLLIPFVHREGAIGQQARDALLLCMALSQKNESIGLYIAENSNFCPVLATGLSGLYSVLPRKLTIVADDWYRLTHEDIQEFPELTMFLNSLEFCNAVIQVSHAMVQEQLLEYIYQGFLIPVMGPALHQDTADIDVDTLEGCTIFANTLEEIVTATAYLDLFLRTVTEPQLLLVFFKFLITESYESHRILNTLINRIGGHSRLCLVTMALFRTLLDFNCEDIMLELVLKYLVPCSHVMVSQRSRVCDIDLYSCAAEKFLSLIPACCTGISAEEAQLPLLRDGFPMERVMHGGSLQIRSRRPRRSFSGVLGSYESGDMPRSFTAVLNGAQQPPSVAHTGYHLYLADARQGVRLTRRACSGWSSSYDEASSVDLNGATVAPDTKTEDASAEESSVSAGDSGIFVTREAANKGGFEAFGSPNIGPFLSILLTRLEMMPQNSVYINLQLTALIARLALYPQPLLRSFLLSHSLVFQPSVRSLFQVLGSLKHKVDSYSYTLHNFDELLARARVFFAVREERLLADTPHRLYGDQTAVRRSQSFAAEFSRGESKRRSLGSFFRRTGLPKTNPVLVETGGEEKSYRFIARPYPSEFTEEGTRLESIKTQNAVLAAVVLEEFLKELAAISQEHAIQQLAS
ncbi:FHF complex subunit HOOK-interacting protein 1B isoform X1 [Dermacentor andersoni]|uniref:FHF complex subunit HOOK-interacting protein 1B isoform X1 n=1 Tax=Dermacentor andersoni TaxID=34620 RepID=UPI0021552AE6|nr:FHF complex subunit HOOK interacting protein 1B-like isoform X1 [Dermacentor andersoni]XP_054929719.1 FHF complex subunit HOOK interacting protein 1B-like isoform X1 [Dermacentor andersoni]